MYISVPGYRKLGNSPSGVPELRAKQSSLCSHTKLLLAMAARVRLQAPHGRAFEHKLRMYVLR